MRTRNCLTGDSLPQTTKPKLCEAAHLADLGPSGKDNTLSKNLNAIPGLPEMLRECRGYDHSLPIDKFALHGDSCANS